MDIHDFNLLWFTLILKMSFFFSFSAIPPGTLGTINSLHDRYNEDT